MVFLTSLKNKLLYININLGNLLEDILNMTRRQKGGIRTWISKAQNFRKKLVYLESESRKPVF